MWFKTKKTDAEEEDGLFTKAWMEDWFESINRSKEFKQKGKNWNAPLILKINPLPKSFQENDATGIYLNLKYGECVELRYSKKNDEDRCDIILTADEKTWIQLMGKGADPTSMILNNRLSLEKGSLILLSTQAKAAKTLLKTAPLGNIQSLQVQEEVHPRGRTKFISTSEGLNMNSLPMKLNQESQKQRNWWPENIDNKKDIEDWKDLTIEKKKVITHLMSHILAYEEASIVDHLPIMQMIAQNYAIDNHVFMTSLLYDDTKHLELLSGYAIEVMGKKVDFEQYHANHFKTLLYKKLPRITNIQQYDSSPIDQLKSFCILNIIIKGTLASTYYKTLAVYIKEEQILPGLMESIHQIMKDEAYHHKFAQNFINHVLNKNKKLEEPLERTLSEFLTDATNIIQEMFTFYNKNEPFEEKKESLLNQTVNEYQKRLLQTDLRY